MALQYKLEFNTPSGSSDDSVYIHLRQDPVFQTRIGKESYTALPDDQKQVLITELFDVPGVVELSTKATRLWLMKSPIFSWQEVIQPVLFILRDSFGETSIESLPGSAFIDGTGFRLTSDTSRRTI
jgi:hypothetical protein